jgi:hypothetical protein
MSDVSLGSALTLFMERKDQPTHDSLVCAMYSTHCLHFVVLCVDTRTHTHSSQSHSKPAQKRPPPIENCGNSCTSNLVHEMCICARWGLLDGGC